MRLIFYFVPFILLINNAIAQPRFGTTPIQNPPSEWSAMKAQSIVPIETKNLPGADERHVLNAIASPDALFVAYELYGSNLFVLDLATGSVTDLGQGHRPKWAPDSRHLVYMILTENDHHEIESAAIHMASVDGTINEPVFRSSEWIPIDPVFSSDGSRLLFYSLSADAPYYLEVLQ